MNFIAKMQKLIRKNSQLEAENKWLRELLKPDGMIVCESCEAKGLVNEDGSCEHLSITYEEDSEREPSTKIICRIFGHKWYPTKYEDWLKTGVNFRCHRCFKVITNRSGQASLGTVT